MQSVTAPGISGETTAPRADLLTGVDPSFVGITLTAV